jgi:GT2 family glycosyltransferase
MIKTVSIIIPTFNNVDTLKGCITSVLDNSPPSCELIVINNNSHDGTATYLESLKGVRHIRCDENLFFTKAINLGVGHATGKYLFFLNDDCVVLRKDWVDFYQGLLEQDRRIGAVGPYWKNIDELPYGWIEPYAAMVPRKQFVELGGLPYHDDSFVLWWSDIYYTYKLMQHGYYVVPLSRTVVERYIHHLRVGESGQTVLKFKKILPKECFQFHGKATMYERLGIGGDHQLVGYYQGHVYEGESLVGLQQACK